MNKPQWIFITVSILAVIGLYAATQNNLFGVKTPSPKTTTASSTGVEAVSIDSILFHAKEALTPQQITRLTELEHGISRGDVATQKLHAYHQLANFWKDSARLLAPFAWYSAEAARLENSEKSLTFAARLFLQGLKDEQNPQIKQWEALQAKDLFERSLKLNPTNDSSKVFLGEVYIYGGIASPMEGIGLIREVTQKDSNNIQAIISLGEASLVSGQMDKAADRFIHASRLEPTNAEYTLRVADVYERMSKKEEAISWYKKSLPLITIPALKKEVEKRISQLQQ